MNQEIENDIEDTMRPQYGWIIGIEPLVPLFVLYMELEFSDIRSTRVIKK